jgi:Bacterial virulence factor lipase N-terminal
MPRISIPFSGNIDVSTMNSGNVFLIGLGSTVAALTKVQVPPQIIGIDQVVWDPATQTVYFSPADILDEHSRYALIMTAGLRDIDGQPVQAAPAASQESSGLPADIAGYLNSIPALGARVRRASAGDRSIAVLSVFTTQSATYLAEKIRR